jgi:FemAB-related protein (PEP-CTERM system-associated)
MIERRDLPDSVKGQIEGEPRTRSDGDVGVMARSEGLSLASRLEKQTRYRYSSVEDDDGRDAYLRSRSDSTVFHLSGWSRAVERAFGAQRRDLIATRDDKIVGVLPISSCKRPFGRDNWISAPWGVYGGPVSDSSEISRKLVESAMERAGAAGANRLELRCLEDPKLDGFEESDLYVTFRKQLPSTEEEVFRTFPRTERKYLRHAVDRHGLSVEEGHGYRSDLAKLFLSSKRTLGSPGLPDRWWGALEAEMGLDYVLHAARRGDEILGVTLTFTHGKEAYMYYIGTTPEANRECHVTTYLIAKCMEWSVRQGLEVFDLGRSRKDAGAYTFKMNQGFEPKPLAYRYGLIAEDSKIPSFTPSNPKTAVLRRTWSKLPLWACDSLSNRVSSFLP